MQEHEPDFEWVGELILRFCDYESICEDFGNGYGVLNKRKISNEV